MPDATPATTHRLDYRPPAFLVDTVDLRFELDPDATLVQAKLTLRRNPAHGEDAAPLFLNGEALTLLGLSLDGTPLGANQYTVAPDGLTIPDLPHACTLDIETRIAPSKNTELSGLYTSGGTFFTQCEAEGFRRITYFPDRPDVMARYTTTIIADPAVKILLSNGNPGEHGTLADGRHFATWTDPHPKPCYLFALVGGDLVAVRDQFVTRSGGTVQLAIWVRPGDEDRCGHAMAALKHSMAWDERTFGLEYDLDTFNIAAVSDFNMGAMENKGLNVFNTKYVLARPETATDEDYENIERVIAHEYFHNWTGNRVTCRDWFQLSLKEGLTVFRDQLFSADMGSAAVKRITDVRRLRAAQFPEDDGPLAHPVRPDSYIAIDNFYTPTVYEKGAEICRMLYRMVGPAGFRRGMECYIARHDNQAVTIEDFVRAIGEGAGADLMGFLAWYSQAGTPELTALDEYDEAAGRFILTLRQSTRPTPGQPDKRPLPIPVACALLGPDGQELPGRLAGETAPITGERMLLLDQAEQRFIFEDVPAAPTPSLLRGFSAPVKLGGVARDRLRFLATSDTDPFVRWDAGQQYATAVLLDLVEDCSKGKDLVMDGGLVEAGAALLAAADTDRRFAAEALLLPSEAFIADQMAMVDPDAIHTAREFVRGELGRKLEPMLRDAYRRLADPTAVRIDREAIGRRALRNVVLAYLAAAGADGSGLARAQFDAATNMTDSLAALSVLAASDGPHRAAALDAFYRRWRTDALVLDKWFSIQATSPLPGTLDAVAVLRRHPDFDLANPNRVRALVGAFSAGNQVRFHDPSGAGYRFLADTVIELDASNSQTASRLAGPLGNWRRQDVRRRALMRAELERILATPKLSRLTYEKASKALG
jgi:aminopeptidase N